LYIETIKIDTNSSLPKIILIIKLCFKTVKFCFFIVIIFYVIESGAEAQILKWRDLPNSPYNPGGRFDDVYFINPDTGWIISISDVVRTNDGGNNWDTTFRIPGGNFRSIGFFDPQNGLLGTLSEDSNKVLYRTTNGGVNYTAINNLPPPGLKGTCGINIVDENTAYICGRWFTPARILKTTDKGISWTSFTIDTALANSFVDCYFWSADSGIVVGGYRTINFSAGKSAILMTTNSGVSWQRVYVSSRNGEYCWKISFINKNTGYVSTERSGFTNYLKTTNGGFNWEEKPFINNYTVQGIGFLNETTGWIGGFGGANYETTDSGNSWHIAGWGRQMNRVRFLNDSLGYAVGQRTYKFSSEPVGITNISNEVPDRFQLFQNYPNPFNPATIIKFDIENEHDQHVNLIIFDALGKRISTLVNEKLNAGTYEVDFDGNNYPSGLYFYKLQTNKHSETKRMILLK